MSQPAAVEDTAPEILIPLKDAHGLITTFTTFLTVSIHNILFYRKLYPSTTFLSARAYNLPVHQNRHPRVCSWIRDAVDAVAGQLALGTVDRVAVVVHAPLDRNAHDNPKQNNGGKQSATDNSLPRGTIPPGAVLERWMFDTSRFPAWPGGADAMRDYANSLRRRDEEEEEEEDERFAPAAPDEEDESGDDEAAHTARSDINWVNVEEQFRGVLRRLSYAAEKLDALPAGCTFTVAVELRDEAQAPIGHPQPWIPSQPTLQKAPMSRGTDLGGAKTTPIRSLEAGPLFFECWVEEGKAKDLLKESMSARENIQSSAS